VDYESDVATATVRNKITERAIVETVPRLDSEPDGITKRTFEDKTVTNSESFKDFYDALGSKPTKNHQGVSA
jgi:hypothetical protein